jgi:phenylacetaldehyde dehydrogenase
MSQSTLKKQPAVEPSNSSSMDVHNPATGEVIAQVLNGGVAEVDRAVDVAYRAFNSGTWTRLGNSARAKILWRVAELLEAHADELSELETRNNGMPRSIAQHTISAAAEIFRYNAGWCTKIHGSTSDVTMDVGGPARRNFHAYTLKEPIGVAGLITPWNFPIIMACCKLAPALAAGCTCVLKPAEETPLTALRLVDLLLEGGIPPGVVSIVTGEGHSAGAALVAHHLVSKISFTGSTEVGKAIVGASAASLKRLSLELGGKSPVVIFDDADLEQAVPGAAMGAFLNSGQICISGSRLYVARKRFDEVVDRIVKFGRSLVIGDGMKSDTGLGPLISLKQMERVLCFIEEGRYHGASVLSGGSRLDRAGYFIEPTVVVNAKETSKLIKEEIFGPVITATPFDDVDEVAALANDTSYGLAAGIWTQNLSRAHLLAKRLQAGTVWINCQTLVDPSVPFGGYKQSGWGKEYALDGVESFMQTKAVFAAL